MFKKLRKWWLSTESNPEGSEIKKLRSDNRNLIRALQGIQEAYYDKRQGNLAILSKIGKITSEALGYD